MEDKIIEFIGFSKVDGMPVYIKRKSTDFKPEETFSNTDKQKLIEIMIGELENIPCI